VSLTCLPHSVQTIAISRHALRLFASQPPTYRQPPSSLLLEPSPRLSPAAHQLIANRPPAHC
jgi:hypothetical protein